MWSRPTWSTQPTPLTPLRRYQALAAAEKRILRTDIPRSLIPALVDLALRVEDRPIRSVVIRLSDECFPRDPDLDHGRQTVDRALEPGRRAATGFPVARCGHRTTMADAPLTDRFIDALQHLEESGEVDDLVALFADDATLHRPEVEQRGAPSEPATDAAAYWRTYRDQFEDVRSEFSVVDGSGETAVLEWTSKGHLRTGRPIEYAGVSLLGTGGGDRVTRFATYYDTAAFLEPSTGDA